MITVAVQNAATKQTYHAVFKERQAEAMCACRPEDARVLVEDGDPCSRRHFVFKGSRKREFLGV